MSTTRPSFRRAALRTAVRSSLRRGALRTAALWPLGLASAAALLWGAHHLGRCSATSTVVSAGPRVEDVRAIAQLAVLRVSVADVIEGHNHGAQAIVLVQGDADVAVDLDRVRIVACDPAARRLELALPRPHVDRPRVNHDRTRVCDLRETGLSAWNPFADPCPELLDECMQAAQECVAHAVADPEYIAQAQERVATLLTGFYRELGWQVSVGWEK